MRKSTLPCPDLPPPVTDQHHVRRNNAHAAFQAFAEERLASGHAPKGLEQAFAELLEISPALWSMTKSGSRPMSDKLARQFEVRLGKPVGWMDEERESHGLTQAEQHTVALALAAYRRTNAEGRRRLRALLKDFS
jgi:hypothetical protein